MLYDAYVVKMKKLVKIRNWIIKYKFLLLAIAVIILAGTISFLASIGSISIVNDCKEEIVYGEKIKFEASAFFFAEMAIFPALFAAASLTTFAMCDIFTLTKRAYTSRYRECA